MVQLLFSLLLDALFEAQWSFSCYKKNIVRITQKRTVLPSFSSWSGMQQLISYSIFLGLTACSILPPSIAGRRNQSSVALVVVLHQKRYSMKRLVDHLKKVSQLLSGWFYSYCQFTSGVDSANLLSFPLMLTFPLPERQNTYCSKNLSGTLLPSVNIQFSSQRSKAAITRKITACNPETSRNHTWNPICLFLETCPRTFLRIT